MPIPQLSNILGAMSLAIADQIVADVQKHIPRDDPAAGLALIGRSPGRSIRDLSLDLKLSHAATVRLVDRLCADGLVRRKKSPNDNRAVALFLTVTGITQFHAMLEDRHKTLSTLVSKLTSEEQVQLNALSEKMLRCLAQTQDERSRICRFCRVEDCVACPIHSDEA
jgi:DNA-binding MarR family transcriptional regulator